MHTTHNYQTNPTQTDHAPELDSQPALDSIKTAPKKPQFKAIARIHAALLPADHSVQLVASNDGACFPIHKIRRSLYLRLLALEPKDRTGFFSFWPTSGNAVTLRSLGSSQSWTTQPGAPNPDELLISGLLHRTEESGFTIKVGRNGGNRRPGFSFIQIHTAPLESWQLNQWLHLQCRRQGTTWILDTQVDSHSQASAPSPMLICDDLTLPVP